MVPARRLRAQDRRMSTPGVGLGRAMRRRLLAFLFGGALIFAVSGGYWLKLRGGFGPGLRVTFVAPSALQLWIGEPVRLSGLRIGEVVKLGLAADATISAEARIDPSYGEWLRADSKVSIGKESLLGDNFVAISAGSAGSAPLDDGSRLAFVPGDSLDERVLRIAEQTEQTLQTTQLFLAGVNDPKGDLKLTLGELRALTAKLDGTRARAELDLGSLQGTLHRVGTSLEKLDGHLAALAGEGGATLAEYQRLASDLRKTTASVDSLVETTQPALEQVLKNSEQATAHLDLAIQAARTHWPFKGRLADRLETSPPAQEATAPP